MSKHIKGESVKFKGSYVAYALIAAVAASASLTAKAVDTFNWSGGQTGVANTEESPYDIWNAANWGGTLPSSDKHFNLSVTEKTYIKSENSSRICNDFCSNSGDFVFMGPLQFYCLKQGSVANSTVSIVKKSGDWTIKTYGMYIGNASGTKATFVNESGNITSTGTSYGVHIGCATGATGIVENVSGDWTIEGSLTVGDASGGTGAFTIKGGSVSSGSALNIANNGAMGTLTVAGGSVSSGNALNIADHGATGTLTVAGGSVSSDGALNIANNGATGTVTVAGGSVSSGGSLYITRTDTNNSGTLTIKDGTVTVDPTGYTIFSQGYGSINLDGGTLVTKRIDRWGSNGMRVQYVNFNGGTLKANAAESLIYARYGYMHVTVGAGGGTIDCNGYPVTIDLAAENDGDNDIEGVGGLTFTGGNTITIKSKVSYSGATRVTPGTILAISNATAKANILGNGLVVAGLPTAGQTIVTHNAALTESDYANISCPLAPDTTYKIGDDGMSIEVYTVGSHPDNFWTGAAGDNNLSTADNWYNGVPTGNALIFSVAPATLTKGETFAPTSITFAEGSEAVTIDGDFTTLTSVTNNSSVNQTFAGFVDFGAGNIDVTATAELSGTEPNQTVVGGCVVFKGGVRGAKVVNHSIVAGNYTLTTDEAFTATSELDRFTINENSSLSVKSADNTCALYIREGATFNVENSVRSSAVNGIEANNCLWSWSKGAYVVSDFTLVAANPSRECWLGGHTFSSAYGTANAGAVLKIGTLTIDSDKFCALHGTGANSGGSTPTIFIGEGGLNIASGRAGYYAARSDIHKTTLRPWNSDFTFGGGSTGSYDFLLGQGVNPEHMGNIKFTLNTDDEAGVPRTITMAARICTSSNTSSIVVAGHGTNVVASASPLMTGTYAVTDAATVVLTNGTGFVNGTVSVGSTATLAVESGTANVGNLTLADGAALAFNWTKRTVLPVLAVANCATVSGAVNVKISSELDAEDRPGSGARVLTSGGGFAGKTVSLAAGSPKWAKSVSVNGDGNIVVDIASNGMMIFVRQGGCV